MRKIITLIFCIITILILPSCSTIEKMNADETGNPYQDNYPVKIYDVSFSTAPQKVVSLSASLTEALYEIGVGDKIVGRGNYCTYPEEVKNIKAVGSPANPDIDAIIELKPDVVITQSPVASIDINRLEKNKIQVLYIPAPKDYYQFIDIYGALAKVFLGNNNSDKTVEKIITPIEEQFSKAEELMISKKYLVITPELNAVATSDTFAGNIFSVYGDNIAEQKTAYTMSEDEIVAAKPDLIFLPEGFNEKNLSEKIRAIVSNPATKVVRIDYSKLENPSVNLAELIEKVNTELATSAGSVDSVVNKE